MYFVCACSNSSLPLVHCFDLTHKQLGVAINHLLNPHSPPPPPARMVVEGLEGVYPQRFGMNLNILLILVLADCVCCGFADHLWHPGHWTLNVVFFALPILIHLLQILIFFFLVGHTFLLKYGLLLELWCEFRSVFFFSLFRFGVLAGARVPRFVAAIEEWPPADFWDDTLFHALFWANNILTVIYDAWLLRKCHSMARVRFFKPQLWQKRKQGLVRSVLPRRSSSGGIIGGIIGGSAGSGGSSSSSTSLPAKR